MWSGLINDETVLHKCQLFWWKSSSPGLSPFHLLLLEGLSEPFNQSITSSAPTPITSKHDPRIDPGLGRPHNTMSEEISNLLGQLEPEIQDIEEGMFIFQVHE